MLSGKWFNRLVLTSWIISAAFILVIFKNMELIVHGQLYNYGLIFSPNWADGYRFFTWLIFLFIGLPMLLSGIALAWSFVKVEKVPMREKTTSQKVEPPRGAVEVKSLQTRQVLQTPQTQQVPKTPQTIKKTPSSPDKDNGVKISCPKCKKVFGRALVMLDFRSGANRMISVCPYCNAVLGYTSEEKIKNEGARAL